MSKELKEFLDGVKLRSTYVNIVKEINLVVFPNVLSLTITAAENINFEKTSINCCSEEINEQITAGIKVSIIVFFLPNGIPNSILTQPTAC